MNEKLKEAIEKEIAEIRKTAKFSEKEITADVLMLEMAFRGGAEFMYERTLGLIGASDVINRK